MYFIGRVRYTKMLQQVERTEDEIKARLQINFVMGINKLPSLEDY